MIDVGYAQGMNDILSRFLVVLNSEAEAYFCFVNYMAAVKEDFIETGMMKKIGKNESLIVLFSHPFFFLIPSFSFILNS